VTNALAYYRTFKVRTESVLKVWPPWTKTFSEWQSDIGGTMCDIRPYSPLPGMEKAWNKNKIEIIKVERKKIPLLTNKSERKQRLLGPGNTN
jgi:hypothetical protein